MKIIIKKLDGKKETFEFDKNDTIDKMKEILANKVGFDKKQVRLIFGGKPMGDDTKLCEYDVKEGSTIHMIMQLRG